MATVHLPLAPYLRGELAARAWSNARLADVVGVSRPTTSRWLNGKSVPEPIRCKQIAELFDLPTTDVLAMAGYLNEDEAPEPETPEERRRRRWLLSFRDLVADVPASMNGVQGILIEAMLDVLTLQLRRLK
jgi:transcriptional regulator with XRE-family HTH domain